MSDLFLYNKLEVIEEHEPFADIPIYIKEGLNGRILLREYQLRAFQYFIKYYQSERLRNNNQLHLLFHMATGSGKTVMMAGLMLYLYTKGYRNFLFFVNQVNILEKTKDNFLNKLSSKYLFSEEIEINGKHIIVKEVSNFSTSDIDAINICFTTTQKLHLDLSTPKENSPTIEDFVNEKVVLISDEAHHVNTNTKKSKLEEEGENSWEYSVKRIFKASRENALIEFTATVDLKDPNVLEKYKDKIVFDYTLRKFRESGYTKDFQNVQVDSNVWDRTLGALVISEYRRHLFGQAKQNIKPVVLLKSKTIKESEDFYELFFNKLNHLSSEEILSLKNKGNNFYDKAVDYFILGDSSLNSLVTLLKTGFSINNSIIMNSASSDSSKDKQLAVNSLEDEDNPYRLIFTVDMLTEGWDVLNLFDIVRLFETRDAGVNKPGKTTIKEAQLIGRGARYCPYAIHDYQDRFRRKFDDDIDNDYRILETLLYHSMQNSRYINELRIALKETGLIDQSITEVTYRLKESFKNTAFYNEALVFTNSRVEKSRDEVKNLDREINKKFYQYKVSSKSTRSYGLFDDFSDVSKVKTYHFDTYVKDIPFNISISALSNFPVFRFNILKKYYPNLSSIREFLSSDDFLGLIRIQFESPYSEARAIDLFSGFMSVLKDVSLSISSIQVEFIGSYEFSAKDLNTILKDKTKRINANSNGEGVSQRMVQDDTRLDLSDKDWFIFDDNFGTSEEKAFVKYFQGTVDKLKQEFKNVYLIRNERFSDLAIYDFQNGARFEPDFLLFLQKDEKKGYIQQQIFIEPKGNHLLEKEKWKEDFLLSIKESGLPVTKYVDDNKYLIIGLPFFNKDQRFELFDKSFKGLLINE